MSKLSPIVTAHNTVISSLSSVQQFVLNGTLANSREMVTLAGLLSTLNRTTSNTHQQLRNSIRENEVTTDDLRSQLSRTKGDLNRFSMRMTYFEDKTTNLSGKLVDVTGMVAVKLMQFDQLTSNLNETTYNLSNRIDKVNEANSRFVRSVNENNSFVSRQLANQLAAISEINRDCMQRNQNLTEQVNDQGQKMLEMAQNITQSMQEITALRIEVEDGKKNATYTGQRLEQLEKRLEQLFVERNSNETIDYDNRA